MRQSRLMSLVEACANVASASSSRWRRRSSSSRSSGCRRRSGRTCKLALVFTGVSIARSYALRRLFEAFR